ncbi:hypothetical protein [Streptomyces gobitricini]|uniref:Uncharacterized protein n=1 Tax=Streptomyces gobitricini TaxID=68211 RepID=A0ABN3LSV7_9ACTN
MSRHRLAAALPTASLTLAGYVEPAGERDDGVPDVGDAPATATKWPGSQEERTGPEGAAS